MEIHFQQPLKKRIPNKKKKKTNLISSKHSLESANKTTAILHLIRDFLFNAILFAKLNLNYASSPQFISFYLSSFKVLELLLIAFLIT